MVTLSCRALFCSLTFSLILPLRAICLLGLSRLMYTVCTDLSQVCISLAVYNADRFSWIQISTWDHMLTEYPGKVKCLFRCQTWQADNSFAKWLLYTEYLSVCRSKTKSVLPFKRPMASWRKDACFPVVSPGEINFHLTSWAHRHNVMICPSIRSGARNRVHNPSHCPQEQSEEWASDREEKDR